MRTRDVDMRQHGQKAGVSGTKKREEREAAIRLKTFDHTALTDKRGDSLVAKESPQRKSESVVLLIGFLYVTFNFKDNARIVDSIRCDGDGLVEATDVVGVVADIDVASLARHNGFLGPFRGSATAACLDIGEDERFVARIGKGKSAGTVATFLDGAIVVLESLELDFRAVEVLIVRLRVVVLSKAKAAKKGEKAQKKELLHDSVVFKIINE